MPSFLSFPLWKLGTIGAGIVSVILTALLIASAAENRDIAKQRNELSARINDPKTGYVAQLAQSRTNEATLKVALDTQRASFEKKAREREAVLAQTQRTLAAAQAQSRSMQVKLDRFLATKPQGATLEDRVRDIDQRAISELLQ